MNEGLNEWCIYIALSLCIAVHPKRFTIMWGGGGGGGALLNHHQWLIPGDPFKFYFRHMLRKNKQF